MNVCVLSLAEKIAFEVHGHTPSCKAHRHITKNQAFREVEDEGAEWVGDRNWYISRLAPKVWCVPYRGALNLQLVDGVIQGRKGTFRYPVPAKGAHSRRLAPARYVQFPVAQA